LMARIAILSQHATMIFERTQTTLVFEGWIVQRQVRRAELGDNVLVAAPRQPGATTAGLAPRATREPRGTISVELKPEAENATFGELRQAFLDLQRHLDERLSAFERGERGALGGDGVPR
jgi:uncharacterized membrane protein YcaP (DUF421 family)